ncbi:Rpn family recombination-promoting nuclease/putative transposase [Candidatus Poribacteria bacterium]|nr:Rpn family recombination-promoting nuclease/putative transposase [Candidatus Poribacteria bacterium]
MNIHDSGYKKLFSNRTIFRQLLETFVNQEWVHSLDFDTCEPLDKSFISEHYKETESDLIYKIQFQDREVYIYILIEFQSTVDPFMALRVLNYITNFYMDFLVNNKSVKKLPTVFPIVLYNGEARWTAPVNLSELIEQTPPLGAFGLDFQYFLIAENRYSQEALLKIRNIVSTLFLAESYYDVDVLEVELLNLFSSESDKQAVSLFLNWFKQLAFHGRLESDDYESLESIYRTEEEVKTMLVTALEREREQIFQNGLREGEQKGKQEGLLEGKQEGRIEGRIETAKAMLAKGMEMTLISEITNLPEAQLLELRDGLFSIKK